MRAKTLNKQWKNTQNIVKHIKILPRKKVNWNNSIESDLTGLVAAVRDSISACVIHMLLVDCTNSKQVRRLREPGRTLAMLAVRVAACWLTALLSGCWRVLRDSSGTPFPGWPSGAWACAEGCWCQSPSESLCLTDLPWWRRSLRWHGMLPRTTQASRPTAMNQNIMNYRSMLLAKRLERRAGHTSSHVTTVGPSHDAKGRPWRHASSNKSCLTKKKRDFRSMLFALYRKKVEAIKNCGSVRAGAFMLRNVLAVKCQKLRWHVKKSLVLSHFFLLRRSFSTVPVPSLVSPKGSAEPRSSEGVEAGEIRRYR